MAEKLIFIDCDSTLSSIEGIDELARMRGEAVFRECQNMTNRAMDGEIAIEAIYGARLDLIRPSLRECEEIGQLYIDTIEPTAVAFAREVREMGWEPIIVSGGLTQAIAPFAAFLEVERFYAVDLLLDQQGHYVGFDRSCPTSRMGGKQEVIREVREAANANRVVMVGDGSSDLETQPFVDQFIGYGGFVERALVKEKAMNFVYKLTDILPLLKS